MRVASSATAIRRREQPPSPSTRLTKRGESRATHPGRGGVGGERGPRHERASGVAGSRMRGDAGPSTFEAIQSLVLQSCTPESPGSSNARRASRSAGKPSVDSSRLGRPRHRSAPRRARAGTETVRRTGRGGRAPAGMETGGRARGQRADARGNTRRGARRGDERARMKKRCGLEGARDRRERRRIGRGRRAETHLEKDHARQLIVAELAAHESNAARYRASTDTDAGPADASARDASHASRTALRHASAWFPRHRPR